MDLRQRITILLFTSFVTACSSTDTTVASVDTDSVKKTCSSPIFVRTPDPSVKGNSKLMFTNGKCSKHFGLQASSDSRIARAEQRQEKNIKRDQQRYQHSQ